MAMNQDSPLFRQEVLDAKRPQFYGAIVLTPDASSRWVALIALSVVVALGALIALGSYTRRSTVVGQLHPNQGLIRVTASQAGVVVEQHARDGQEVKRGDVLFVLSGDRMGPDTQGYQRGIAAQIEARRRSLEQDLNRVGASEAQEAEQLRRRAASLRAELEPVSRQAQQLSLRIGGAEDAVRRYEGLYKQGYVSRDELLAKESELTELRTRLQGGRRDVMVLERDLSATQRDLDTLRARFADQRSERERSILLARQEFTEIEARRRVVVTAPADGKVTLMQGEVGQSIEPSRSLVHLIPSTTKLEARLYAPSRATGFVQPGATVLLRYDAFPYQKFGQHVGKVVSISTAGVGAAEIQGFSQRPELAGEPLFTITVSLPAQTINGADRALPLQAGMRVEADMLHETRRLYEWILEPLFAARARMNQG